MSLRLVRALGSSTLLAAMVACSGAQASPQPTPEEGDRDEPDSYSDVITEEAVTDSGMFHVHWVDDELFYEIPVEMLDEELLLVSRVARTATGVGYGGQKFNTQTVVWQRNKKQILLRTTGHINVADDSLSISMAIENSNLDPVIRAFDIAAWNDDSTTVVIEVTPLFATDVPLLGLSRGRRTAYGVRRPGGLDLSRTFVQSAKSFPRNIEIRNSLTYNATEAPSNASTGTVTIEMNHSMIRLPEVPMQPRLRDDRVGYFSITQTDYGLEDDILRLIPER